MKSNDEAIGGPKEYIESLRKLFYKKHFEMFNKRLTDRIAVEWGYVDD